MSVLAATVAAFVAGGAYYSVVPAPGEGSMPPWKLVVELGRCLVLAAVVAGLAANGDVDTWSGGLLLGLVLWAGFPFVLWVGAVIHENTPIRLAVIHGGDWLLKLLLVGTVVAIL
jgi:Protein of unknown function (DUF1761)